MKRALTSEQRLAKALTLVDRLVTEAFTIERKPPPMPSKPSTDQRVAEVARILRENPGRRGHQLVAQKLGITEAQVAASVAAADADAAPDPSELRTMSTEQLGAALGAAYGDAFLPRSRVREPSRQATVTEGTEDETLTTALGGRSLQDLSTYEIGTLMGQLYPR